MEALNFTQFCIKNGFPSDYDTMFQAQLLGSRGLAGRISQRSIKIQDESFDKMMIENSKAHQLFYNAIKSGELLDSEGKLTQDGIIKSEKERNNKAIQSQIDSCESYIKFVSGMSTSHLKNGKLKKSYQIGVDHHLAQINELKNQTI